MDDFETFYREHLRLVYAAALSRRSDPEFAEDVVQETFFRAWRHRETLDGLSPPARRAWLVRTASGVVVDDWRSRRARETREAAWSDEKAHGPHDLAATADLRVDLAAALGGLEETDRRIVLMRYYLQMTSGEIGETLEMPEGTVRYRLNTAREKMARRLNDGAREEGR